MKKVCSVLAVLMSSLYLSSATAGVTVIDFDKDANGVDIGHGQIVDDEYANWGVNISSSAAQDPNRAIQVSFDTRLTGQTRDPD
jgi:hypothetical protein